MRRPKGIKTKKSVAKRFKITGTGKVMRSTPAAATCPTKNAKRRRRLGKAPSWIQPTPIASCKMPFSH
jgi:ribosomal protein L35